MPKCGCNRICLQRVKNVALQTNCEATAQLERFCKKVGNGCGRVQWQPMARSDWGIYSGTVWRRQRLMQLKRGRPWNRQHPAAPHTRPCPSLNCRGRQGGTPADPADTLQGDNWPKLSHGTWSSRGAAQLASAQSAVMVAPAWYSLVSGGYISRYIYKHEWMKCDHTHHRNRRRMKGLPVQLCQMPNLYRSAFFYS